MDSPRPAWTVSVLGPSSVRGPSGEVTVARQDLRVLTSLAVLAHDGQLVDSATIEEHSWTSPPSPRSLQSAVYRLRELLGEDAIVTGRRTLFLSGRVGVDLDEFVDLAAAPEGRAAALALVRGTPFKTMDDHPGWRAMRAAWKQRIEAVRDGVVASLLESGRLHEATEVLVAQLSETPTITLRWVRLVDALSALGRRVEALRVVEYARRAMARAGLEVDQTLRDRESVLLAGEQNGPATPPTRRSRAARATSPERAPGPVATELVGRGADIERVVEALRGPRPGVVVHGRPGFGARSVAAAAAATVTADGAVSILLGPAEAGDAACTDALRSVLVGCGHDAPPAEPTEFDVATAALTLGRPVVVEYGDVVGRPAAVWRSLIRVAGLTRGRMRVLGWLAARPTEHSGDPNVTAIGLEPVDDEALCSIAGEAAAAEFGVDRLRLLTGGAPADARAIARMFGDGRRAHSVGRRVVHRRLAGLDTESGLVWAAAAMLGGRATRHQVAATINDGGSRLDEALSRLVDEGLVSEGPDQSVVVDPWLAGLLVDVLNLETRTMIAAALHRVLDGDTDATWARAALAMSSDRDEGWRGALHLVLGATAAEVEADPDAAAELISSLIVALERDRVHNRDALTRLRSRRAMVNRVRGRTEEWTTEMTQVIATALRPPDPSILLATLIDASYPAVVTATDDGEACRRFADSILRLDGIDEHLRLTARAVQANQELARGSLTEGRSMAAGLLEEALPIQCPVLRRRNVGHGPAHRLGRSQVQRRPGSGEPRRQHALGIPSPGQQPSRRHALRSGQHQHGEVAPGPQRRRRTADRVVRGVEQSSRGRQGGDHRAAEDERFTTHGHQLAPVEPGSERPASQAEVQVEVGTVRADQRGGLPEASLPPAAQWFVPANQAGGAQGAQRHRQVVATDQQVGVGERPHGRVGLVEMGVGQPLEHPDLDAPIAEQPGDAHGQGLAAQAVVQGGEVVVVNLIDQRRAGHERPGAQRSRGQAGDPIGQESGQERLAVRIIQHHCVTLLDAGQPDRGHPSQGDRSVHRCTSAARSSERRAGPSSPVSTPASDSRRDNSGTSAGASSAAHTSAAPPVSSTDRPAIVRTSTRSWATRNTAGIRR